MILRRLPAFYLIAIEMMRRIIARCVGALRILSFRRGKRRVRQLAPIPAAQSEMASYGGEIFMPTSMIQRVGIERPMASAIDMHQAASVATARLAMLNDVLTRPIGTLRRPCFGGPMNSIRTAASWQSVPSDDDIHAALAAINSSTS